MESISALLGHDKLRAAALRHLETRRHTRVALSGGSGSGKTYIATELSAAWRLTGGNVLLLRGDPGRRQEPYYPFKALLRGRASSGELRDWMSTAAKNLPRLFSLTEPIADLALDSLVRLRRMLQQRSGLVSPGIRMTDPDAIEFLTLLHNLSRKGAPLIVLDDLNLFDEQSLQLISSLILRNAQNLSDDTHEGYLLLATENTDELEHVEQSYEGVRALFHTMSVPYSDLAAFPSLLRAAGLKQRLAQHIVVELYRASKGHLRVVRELAHQLQDNTSTISLGEDDDLVRLIYTIRLNDLGTVGGDLREVLAQAAIIGSSFYRVELECLVSTRSSGELLDLIQLATQLEILAQDGPQLIFQHGALHRFFLSLTRASASFHRQYADCLQVLRASDYGSRAYHLERAGDSTSASIAALQHTIGRFRAGDLEAEARLPLLWHPDLDTFLTTLRTGYELLQREDTDAAALTVRALHDAFPPVLLAEKYYLLCESLLSGFSRKNIHEALKLLRSVTPIVSTEYEISFRLHYLLFLAEIETGSFEEARETRNLLSRLAAQHVATDHEVYRQLLRMQLIADGIDEIEVSGRRIRSALQSIETRRRATGHFNPGDLFVAYTNFAGNQLVAAQFSMARRASMSALALTESYSRVPFPTPWAAWNNLLLAEFMDGDRSASSTVDGFKYVEDVYPQASESILFCVNKANLLMLSGDAMTAMLLLDRSRAILDDVRDPDEYFLYYSEHSRAICLFLFGRLAEARRIWSELESQIGLLLPGIRDYLAHRHALLGRHLLGEMPLSSSALDSLLAEEPLYRGKPWLFFRHGFLFTDIQVWYRL